MPVMFSLAVRENPTETYLHRLEDLEAFVATVEEGSLSAAARRLRRSLQAVSRSLMTLEKAIGVELLRRTTRRSNLTSTGAAFYEQVRPALLALQEATLEAANQRSQPSGLLRVTAPVQFAPIYLVPAVVEFMENYPAVEVELKLSDRFVDLVDEGFDLAIRIGHLADSTLRARTLGEIRRVVYGAPAYFERHGRPRHPADLVEHQCLTRSIEMHTEAWPFLIDGVHRTIQVSGRLRSDNTAATYAAARLGVGLGFTPLWQIRDAVDSGEFEIVLSEYELPPLPLHAVYPPSKLPLPKARLFVDLLAQRLKAGPL